MDVTFSLFVRALRKADILVSPAETLDAFSILKQVGISDRSFLKDALSLALAKTETEKETFSTTFDRFFGQLGFLEAPKRSMLANQENLQLPESFRQAVGETLSLAIQEMLEEKREKLSSLLQSAATELNIQDIATLREKRSFELAIGNQLGLPQLMQYLNEDPDADTVALIRYVQHYLNQQIHEYVDRQYQLHVDPTFKKSVVEAALKRNLNHMPPEYYVEVRRVVERLAEQLRKAYRKRSKRTRRGTLEFRRTMRENMKYDGNLVELNWRKIRKEQSTVFVICDVSNSMASITRFLLLFLYELVDVLPQLRAFAFSSKLGEVTELLRDKPSDTAIEEALFDWGKGNTDYGQALRDFRRSCSKDLNRRTTLVILGDARSNFYEPEVSVLAELSQRVRHVFWLNPETRSQWREGDSEMARYAPHCTDVLLCNQLQHIERFAGKLLTATR